MIVSTIDSQLRPGGGPRDAIAPAGRSYESKTNTRRRAGRGSQNSAGRVSPWPSHVHFAALVLRDIEPNFRRLRAAGFQPSIRNGIEKTPCRVCTAAMAGGDSDAVSAGAVSAGRAAPAIASTCAAAQMKRCIHGPVHHGSGQTVSRQRGLLSAVDAEIYGRQVQPGGAHHLNVSAQNGSRLEAGAAPQRRPARLSPICSRSTATGLRALKPLPR